MNKIIINSDIEMPLGKKIAQVSHGAMRLAIERFEEIGDKLILHDEKSIGWLSDWLHSGFLVDIEYSSFLKNETMDNNGTISLITDRGRTVFNGVETNTVIGFTDHKLPIYYHTSIPDNREDEVRQIFIVNKKAIENENEFLAKIASVTVANIYNIAEWTKEGALSIDLKLNPSIREWIFSGYAKIALRVKNQKKMNDIIEEIDEINQDLDISSKIYYNRIENLEKETTAICLRPYRKSKTIGMTKKLQLF